MLIRFLIRRAIRGSYRSYGLKNLSRVKGRRGYNGSLVEDAIDLAPRFDEQAWEEGVNDILSWAEDQAGNAGQTTLIVDYLSPKVLDYCELTQEEYDPDEFVDVMKDELGDDYYYAINEIIDEMSLMLDELRDACHESFLENVASRLQSGFRSTSAFFSTPNRVYSSYGAAYSNYQAAAARNGYRIGTSSADAKFNANKRRQSLIQRFGTGPTKPFGSSKSGMESMPGYAAYQQAAARNGKIIKP